MANAGRYLGQAIFYGVLIALIGYCSTAPSYTQFDEDVAIIKLSFKHAGKVKGECRQRTPEELAKMAPNMRVLEECPRERSPLTVELMIDGELAYSAALPPRGLKKDGMAAMYRRMSLPAGRHMISVKMNDDVKTEGFTYVREEAVELKARQVFVIDFDHAHHRFTFR